MAISDWNTVNSERSYPFQENAEASGLQPYEILDARFFIINSTKELPKVWLRSKELLDAEVIYIFQTDAFSDLTTAQLEFRVPKQPQAQCVWNTDNDSWNGYCVFGAWR